MADVAASLDPARVGEVRRVGHRRPASRVIEERDPAGDDPIVAPLGSPWRPSWRGRIHVLALVAAVPLLVALAIEASGARARAAVVTFGVALCSMLTVSATYHRWVHTKRARTAWRRADHATIYVMIAGTCTALALTALDTGWTIALLVPIWAAAVTGAFCKIALFDRAHRFGGALYIILGWSGLLLAVPVWRQGGALPVALLFAGGVVYTVGALGFTRRWPTLSPSRFSYHEVWHTCTIAAAGLHFGAIATLAT
jgi:hemolysin III